MHARNAVSLTTSGSRFVCFRCRLRHATYERRALRYQHSDNAEPDKSKLGHDAQTKRLARNGSWPGQKQAHKKKEEASTAGVSESYSQKLQDALQHIFEEQKQEPKQVDERKAASIPSKVASNHSRKNALLKRAKLRERRRARLLKADAERSSHDAKGSNDSRHGENDISKGQAAPMARSILKIERKLSSKRLVRVVPTFRKRIRKVWVGTPESITQLKALVLHVEKRISQEGNAANAEELPKALDILEKRQAQIDKETSSGSRPKAKISQASGDVSKSADSKVARGRTSKKLNKNMIQTRNASELAFTPILVEQPSVPKLGYGLERVLFNPGVYQLQDPRSRVYNFDPYLQNIMPINEFDFNALKEYVTSSKDLVLKELAQAHGKRYVGSTSSMTSMLAHFHYLLSQWRPVNTGMLSKTFPAESQRFTELLRCPAAIFLKHKDGTYAIDADKQFDKANVLQLLGKSMEKLFTLKPRDYEKYRRSNPSRVPETERTAPESYHYSALGDFLMRSQLDAHDSRLPGTGMFDLKTRAVVSIRMDVMNYEHGMGYEIRDSQGAFESYEREYYDMIRSAFLKYSMQVRMGRMDGVFVAYHNIQRIFGFQYVSLEDMDLALHGQRDTTLGDQEFALSIDLLNEVLNSATRKYPGKSIRLHFETRDAATPFMYVFAEPVTEEGMANIQNLNKAAVAAFERHILGVERAQNSEEDQEDDSRWEDMEASVQNTMDQDERGVEERKDAGLAEPTHRELFGEDSASAGNGNDEVPTRNRRGETMPSDKNPSGSGNLPRAKSDRPREERLSMWQQLKKAFAGGVPSNLNQVSSQPDQTQGIEQKGESPKNDNPLRALSSDALTADTDNESPQHRSNLPSDSSQEIPSTPPTREENTPPNLASETEGKGIPETRADAPFMEEINRSSMSSGKVLAMTLTLRNKVNGKSVLRPEKLGPADKWSIEYSLVEVSDEHRAWALYQACLTRREKKLGSMPDEDAEKVSYYIRNLRYLSKQGKRWRRDMDEYDRAKPVEIL